MQTHKGIKWKPNDYSKNILQNNELYCLFIENSFFAASVKFCPALAVANTWFWWMLSLLCALNKFDEEIINTLVQAYVNIELFEIQLLMVSSPSLLLASLLLLSSEWRFWLSGEASHCLIGWWRCTCPSTSLSTLPVLFFLLNSSIP